MKKLIFLLCFVILTLTFFSTVMLAADQKEVVTFARGEAWVTLDPHDNRHTANTLVDQLIYDRLIERQHDGSVVPGLAKRWEISEDQQSITFYLQEGVTFHNGEPFTAEAVQVTIHRLRDNPALIRA